MNCGRPSSVTNKQGPNQPLNSVKAGMEYVDNQIQWYDRKSVSNQRWYKLLKTMTIVAASLIPVISGFLSWRHSSQFAAVLGGTVAVFEGLQQLNQFHANWISYRKTCEALRHEKYLYLAGAGPYASCSNTSLLLVERVETIVSQEHAKWSSILEPSQEAAH
jgi:Protein of unknown function (DUF4231)